MKCGDLGATGGRRAAPLGDLGGAQPSHHGGGAEQVELGLVIFFVIFWVFNEDSMNDYMGHVHVGYYLFISSIFEE